MKEKAGIAMICKYCGKKMDPTDAVCPHCHHPATPLVGGNGFWDMGKDPDAAPAAPHQPPEVPVPPAAKEPRQKSRGIVALALVLSIASTALSVGSCFAVRSALKEQQQALDTQSSIIFDQALEIQELKSVLSELKNKKGILIRPSAHAITKTPETSEQDLPPFVGTSSTDPTAETAAPTVPPRKVPAAIEPSAAVDPSSAVEPSAEPSRFAAENYKQTEVPNG